MTKTAYQVLSEKCNEFKSTVDDDIALEAMEEYAQFKVKESLDKVRGKVEEKIKHCERFASKASEVTSQGLINERNAFKEVLEILNKDI